MSKSNETGPKFEFINYEDQDIKSEYNLSPSSAFTRSSIEVNQISTGERYRIKAISYGNAAASVEITMGRIFALTGLLTPKNKYGIGFDSRSEFYGELKEKKDKKYNEEKNIPNYYIASPNITSFQDLGSFLINAGRHFISDKNQSSYQLLREKILELNDRTDKEGTKTALDKKEKIKLLQQIYQLLPKEMRIGFETLYYTSQWIGNWDFLNFDWYNAGFVFNIKNKTWQPTLIDFGNSGPWGFGGKYKDESGEKANLAAKPEPKNPTDKKDPYYKNRNDFDPPLDNKNYHIIENDLAFDEKTSKSISHIASIPRRLPFQSILKEQVRNQSEFFDTPGFSDQYSNAAIEAAFRLSLIPDEAIDKVIDDWYMVGPGKNFEPTKIPFNISENETLNKKYSPDGLKRILKERRTDLCSKIPDKEIENWISKNRAKAHEAMLSVEKQVAELGIEIGDKKGKTKFEEKKEEKLTTNVKKEVKAISSFPLGNNLSLKRRNSI